MYRRPYIESSAFIAFIRGERLKVITIAKLY